MTLPIVDPLDVARAAIERLPDPADAEARHFNLIDDAARGVAEHQAAILEQLRDVAASIARGDRTLREADADLRYLAAVRRRCLEARDALHTYLQAVQAARQPAPALAAHGHDLDALGPTSNTTTPDKEGTDR